MRSLTREISKSGLFSGGDPIAIDYSRIVASSKNLDNPAGLVSSVSDIPVNEVEIQKASYRIVIELNWFILLQHLQLENYLFPSFKGQDWREKCFGRPIPSNRCFCLAAVIQIQNYLRLILICNDSMITLSHLLNHLIVHHY